MRFTFNEANYVTILKHFYPAIAIMGYSDPYSYDSILLNLNGQVKPTKAELDVLIEQVNASSFVQNVGQALNTRFIMVQQFTGTSQISFDNDAPLITEGSEIASIAITPVSVSSKFSFSSTFLVDSDNANRSIAVALFRNNTCFYSNMTSVVVGKGVNLNIEAFDAPGTSDQIIYSLRVGVNQKGTWYINQTNNGAAAGGTTTTPIRISEFS